VNSVTTSQAAIIAPFQVMNRYVGNLPATMPGVFPDYTGLFALASRVRHESAM
jgi:hypothetical protein